MNILEKILLEKRVAVEAAKKSISYERILEQAQSAEQAPSFSGALKTTDGNPAVIAELKKASPSMGMIRENFSPAELAASLQRAGAASLSVLTEENFFLGSPDYLKTAVANVKIPVLRKDFIYDPYQLCEARAWGASAALLIVAMLEKKELTDLLGFAESINLEVLVETHSEAELDTALECGARILGVNSRNLKTFEFDFTLFEKLISRIPDGCVAVAESGVTNRASLLDAAKAGADAALIGTTLMDKPDPSAELKKLLGKI